MASDDDEEREKRATAYDNKEKVEEAIDKVEDVDVDGGGHSDAVEKDLAEAEGNLRRAKREMEDDARNPGADEDDDD